MQERWAKSNSELNEIDKIDAEMHFYGMSSQFAAEFSESIYYDLRK